jgi:hypothetical protein
MTKFLNFQKIFPLFACVQTGNFWFLFFGNWILFFCLGFHRGTFVEGGRHKAEITGLEVTQLNNVLVSSSLDGTIKVRRSSLSSLSSLSSPPSLSFA